MTKAKPLGVALGSAYSGTITKNGRTWSASTPAWGGGSSGGGISVPGLIQIGHQSNLGVAPHPVAFKPDFDLLTMFGLAAPDGVVYDARMHDPAFLWDFGEDYTYTAPQKGIYKQSGTAIGPVAAHTFRTPGTHTVRLDVFCFVNGGLVQAYDEREIVVADPETIFAGDRTIFISPSSDWTHAPAGSVKMTNFLDAFRATQFTWQATAGTAMEDRLPARIMFNRGETHALSGGYPFGYSVHWVKSMHIVAGPGPGAAPIISAGGSGYNLFAFSGNVNSSAEVIAEFKTRDFVFQGLDMRTPFNSATDTSDAYQIAAFSFSSVQPNTVLVDKCTLSGFSLGIEFTKSGGLANAAHTSVFMNDWVCENQASCGMLGGGFNYFCTTGSRVTSHPDTYINNVGGGGWGYRVEDGSSVVVIDASDFFSVQGWAGLDGGWITNGSCFRMGDGGGGLTCVVTRSSFESGYQVVSFAATNKVSLPCNMIFDSNYLLGNYQTVSVLSLAYGGATIRNNVMVVPDSVRLPGVNNAARFIGLITTGGSADPESSDSPVKIYNNTFIDMIGGLEVYNTTNPFTALSVANNVLSTADGPLDQSPVLWEPWCKGYKSSTQYLPETFTPLDVVWPATPEAGSPAIGSATGSTRAYLDFLGNVRPASASRGAVEPA